jgi:hypothetical protein
MRRRSAMGIMSLTEIMDRAIDILRKYIKTIVMFTLGYGLICFAIMFASFIGIMIFISLAMIIFESITLLAIMGIIVGVVIGGIFLSLSIGIIKISAQEFGGERVYAGEAIGAALKSIPIIVGIIFIGITLFIPVMAVFVLIGYLLYAAFDASLIAIDIFGGQEILLVVLLVITIIAAIFVVYAYMTFYVFSLHAVVIEKKGVIGAIKRSVQLLKGNYWKIFWCVALFNLTIQAVVLSIEAFAGSVAGIITLILSLVNFSGDMMAFLYMMYNGLSWPINLLSWLVISPTGTVMIALLYFNQRFKKEGYDISLKLREIQKNEERKQVSEVVDFN